MEALLEERAQQLFLLSDRERKGFIVKRDMQVELPHCQKLPCSPCTWKVLLMSCPRGVAAMKESLSDTRSPETRDDFDAPLVTSVAEPKGSTVFISNPEVVTVLSRFH